MMIIILIVVGAFTPYAVLRARAHFTSAGADARARAGAGAGAGGFEGRYHL